MAVRELDDRANDEEERDRADDEAGEGSAHVGGVRGVCRLSMGMRISHGNVECARFVRPRARC